MESGKHHLTLACTILVVLGLCGWTTQSFAQVAGENLIAHYKLDEGAGSTVASEVNSPATDGVFANAPRDPGLDVGRDCLRAIGGHLAPSVGPRRPGAGR